jgi:uncharacterized repeat protein (TIGR03803 family)
MRKLSLEKIACIAVTFWVLGGVAAFAQTFTSIASFEGTNGANPSYGSLVQGANGNFYGTTEFGGAHGGPSDNRGGAIFEVTPAGVLTTLYSFCAKTKCHDGQIPYGGLTQTANGDFYGTTAAGGTNANSGCTAGEGCCTVGEGCGTLFEFSPEGKLTTLYSFCGQTNCADGAEPEGTLVQGYNGDFYGTTFGGGANVNESVCPGGCGTVFKVTPKGELSTLYSFCSEADCADGALPVASLIQAADGSLYGTTEFGGFGVGSAESCYFIGCGTVFKITPGGTLTTMHLFGFTDGALPYAGLVQASNGDFYGTTRYGGTNCIAPSEYFPECGTVFEITPTGTLTTLHSFCAELTLDETVCLDGSVPTAPLIQATDGNFYGTTSSGGDNDNGGCFAFGCGTLFQITTTGTLTTLHSFCAQQNSDGSCVDADPGAPLLQATDGDLYGTAAYGGSTSCTYRNGVNNFCGTIFSLSTGLAPFVKTLPTARAAGGNVTILGNNLTGTTSVTFNGTAATLITVSDTAITTTVPTGATTGPVAVVTPSGTLTSNVPFQVIP